MSVRHSIAMGMVWAATAMMGQLVWADDGRPSEAVLQQMGLGGMAVLSDDQAESIRGQGYKSSSSVHVAGRSYVKINIGPIHAGDSDDYHADGKYEARGKSFSVTGVIIKSGGGYGHHSSKSKTTSITVFAGGYSSAKAF